MLLFTRFLALAATALPFLAQAAPVSSRSADDLIPGKYIIQLRPDTDIASIAAHHYKVRAIHAHNLVRREINGEVNAGVEREYDFGNFKGYAGSFDRTTIEELKALPEVQVVEQDYIMYTSQENSTTSGHVTQIGATWGLASLSSRTHRANNYYLYDSSAGQGTFSYVVDTGIRTTHVEFEGRAVWGHNAVNDNNTDNHGHGTHVSGIIGSKAYGVAKKTTLVAVKVAEGVTTPTSTMIAGFQWAVKDIVAKGRTSTAVINISMGGRGSAIWDAAITDGWNQGVLTVVAAGNGDTLASEISPARSEEVLCVGMIQSDDSRHPYSNYGPAVDIWAAGTGIVSTFATSDSATENWTGTSMASPHVAGLVSYLRGLEGPSDAKTIKARVLELATPDRLTDIRGAANLLAYNGRGK